jgi:hypothetical protein
VDTLGRRAVVSLSLLLIAALLCLPLQGQTFIQLTDLGQGIGPRITKAVAKQNLGVDLFGEIGTKVK